MNPNWRRIPLGDLITLQRGHDLPSHDRKDGKIPIMGSSGITGFHNETKAKGPGVIIGRSGNSMGKISFVEEDYWPLNTCLYVTDFKGNNPRFIYYLLQLIDFDQFNSGSAQKSLNRNAVYPFEVLATIDYAEQTIIANILADLENKIALNTQINQTLEAMAQALFKSWFVDFDPVKAKMEARASGGSDDSVRRAAMAVISGKSDEELVQFEQSNPTAFTQLVETADLFPESLVESELGLIPEGWEVSEIGDEVTLKGGATPSTKNPAFWDGGEINWTTPKDLSNLKDKVLTETERCITTDGIKKISSGLLPIDTVLLSSRAPVGYSALAKIPVAINQGYIAMVCEKVLPPEFVLLWCESNMDEIKQRASGTTFQEISKRNFKPIKVVVPSTEVIDGFKSKIAQVYEMVKDNVLQSKALQKTRDTLLPKLLSGEIDLSSFGDREVGE